MRAFPALWSQEPDEIAEGLKFAQEAMWLDPSYALPKALAAWGHAQDVVYTRTETPGEDREKVFRLISPGMLKPAIWRLPFPVSL